MKRASILLIFQLFFCISGKPQDNEPDAIREVAAQSFHYYLSKPDTAIILAQEALNAALLSKNRYYEGYCYFILSKAYWVKANYKLSTEYGFKALKLFQNSPYYRDLGNTFLSLARTLVELGNVNKADEFIRSALRLGKDHSDELLEAAAYREQSYLLLELNDLDSALHYSEKGLATFKRNHDSLDVSVLYGRKSRIYFLQKKFTDSRDYAYKALMI